jgi:tetratricopeptide (TPR) repeat protein
MKGTWRNWMAVGALAGALLLQCSVANAQSSQSGSQSGQGQSGQSGQSGQQQGQPPAQQGQPQTQSGQTDKNTLTLDTPPPPVNPEEDSAYKAFDAIPMTAGDQKIKSGEDFAQKYPQSRYLPMIYSMLVKLYLEANNVQKMEETGDKDVAIAPNDVQTLAILGQTIPRAWKSDMPNAQAELDKAEKFSKSAIELTPTVAKPEGLTDAQFVTAKNQTLSMAHAGLGLVYFRRGKFDEAIPELEESTKIDPNPEIDPVNYYVLGIADEKTSHFDAAAAAFNKCSSAPGGLQQTCKGKVEEAKKLGATQLSAPK